MSSITIPMVPSRSTSTVLMGGYACAGVSTFAGRERTAIATQLPGTQVWSPPT